MQSADLNYQDCGVEPLQIQSERFKTPQLPSSALRSAMRSSAQWRVPCVDSTVRLSLADFCVTRPTLPGDEARRWGRVVII